MAKLVKAVHVKDPDRSHTVLLLPGEEPEPRLAALITNPDAWEDGKLPNAEEESADDDSDKDSDGDDKQAAPAAKKTAPKRATNRSRGRGAAGEGNGGD
ncbi:hypothetical protein ACWEGQ_00510 [Streptomyces seoulensis]